MAQVKTSALAFLALLLVIICLPFTAYAEQDPNPKPLTVLFTHDLHSYVLPWRVATKEGTVNETGGFARLKALIDKERAINPAATITVDGGDFAMGTPYHTLFETEALELRLLGSMVYDATTFGNHDFDYHSDGLAKMLERLATSPERKPTILASNVGFKPATASTSPLRIEMGQFPVAPYTVIERGGLRIGLFGLMGKDAAEDIGFAPDVEFLDQEASARTMVETLRTKERVDLVICLSHSGTWANPSRSEDELLAQKVPGIDIIISGHTHTVLPEPHIIGKTAVVSAGCFGQYLGKLTVNVGKDGSTVRDYQLIPVTLAMGEDPAISEQIQKARGALNETLQRDRGVSFDQTLARTTFNLEPVEQGYVDPGEIGLGDLVADAMRWSVLQRLPDKEHETVALEPIGMIRATLAQGDIRYSDAFDVLSLGLGTDGKAGYPIVCFYLNGDELRQALEVHTTAAQEKIDLYMQVAGLICTYNPNRLPFDRVTELSVENQQNNLAPIDSRKLYRVVSNYNVLVGLAGLADRSHGLLHIVPKDQQGQPITDLKLTLVDRELNSSSPQPLKEWETLSEYLRSLPDADGDGIPDLPARYRVGANRLTAKPSWNPVDLIGGAHTITCAALSILVVVVALFVLGIRWAGHRLRRSQ